MKKTYHTPCVEVNEISAIQSMLTTSTVGISETEYDGKSTIQSRGRGDSYEPAEDSDNFGDLW